MKFSDAIYNERLKRGFSLRDAAGTIGISHSYLSALEKGADPRTGAEFKPAPDVLKKIASAYGLDYSYLMALCGYTDFDGDIDIDVMKEFIRKLKADNPKLFKELIQSALFDEEKK
jgi:transcriptional regulator with XRE-family HTH domain